ncbi:MAG: DUF1800 domain-containing protein [Saprospiraceae bacterium]
MSDNPCLKGDLTPYVPRPDKPWNEKRIHHLYNRLSNGASLALVSAAKANTPGKIIDFLLETARTHPLPGEKRSGTTTYDYTYPWKNDNDYNDSLIYNKYLVLAQMWMTGMLTEGVRHKLVVFWSNHFVTAANNFGYYPSWVFQYYFVLHKHALGNFRNFVYEIGRNPAMLHYLDGRLNRKGNPNENYARELLELFTMGPGNYTEKDIEEVAKALTGWHLYYNYDTGTYNIYPNEYYDPFDLTQRDKIPFWTDNHDYSAKRIFGKTYSPLKPSGKDPNFGRPDYDNLHNVIFSERSNEIARFICKKLYKFYMYNDAPSDIVEGMAQVFKQNWSIIDTLKVLFKSEHFFEEESMGAMIKSNLDTMIHIFRSLNLKLGEDFFTYDHNRNTDPANTLNRDALGALYNQTSTIGQTLFNPPNVAGWPGHRSWLSEFVMVNRWRYIRDQFDYYLAYPVTREKYRSFLKDLTNESKDPDLIVRKVIEYFITLPMPEDLIQTAVGVFKSGVPANYYNDGTWSLDYSYVPTQFINLMKHVSSLPEFQLL